MNITDIMELKTQWHLICDDYVRDNIFDAVPNTVMACILSSEMGDKVIWKDNPNVNAIVWYSVSRGMVQSLKGRNQTYLSDYGIHLWGRDILGQPISRDKVISEIIFDMLAKEEIK